MLSQAFYGNHSSYPEPAGNVHMPLQGYSAGGMSRLPMDTFSMGGSGLTQMPMHGFGMPSMCTPGGG